MSRQHQDPWQRYAVLHHRTGHSPRSAHFDLLLLDVDGISVPAGMLITFRVDRWPPAAGDAATCLPPHRPLYLDYEGPISGNRGTVRRIDAGSWRPLTHAPGYLRAELRSATGTRHDIELHRLSGADQRFVVEGWRTETVRNTGPLG